MKPIYFPFTFISKPVVKALGACFRQIVVYRPSCRSVPENMQKLQESDLIKIHIPVSGDEDQLDAISKNYGAWINVHQGSEIAFLKTRADTIPFFDESYASQLRADIKKGKQTKISQEPLEPVGGYAGGQGPDRRRHLLDCRGGDGHNRRGQSH